MAVVSLSLVDGQGSPVRLLHCPRPDPTAHTEVRSLEELNSYVTTYTYKMNPGSRKPG